MSMLLLSVRQQCYMTWLYVSARPAHRKLFSTERTGLKACRACCWAAVPKAQVSAVGIHQHRHFLCREMDPPPTRREALPTPKQKDDNSSIWSIMWSILKESLGKDLTHITLPFFFNEPLSVLQKTMEDLEYADLLNKVHHSLHCCMRNCACHTACRAELMPL